MASRVFLHIGAPKSGTTFLQSVLWQNREALRQRNVLIPGDRLFDHNRASLAVARARQGRKPERAATLAWKRILRDVERWDGDAVISHEWFVLASSEGAARTVEALGGDRVHVIFTARDFVRQVPAAWQEALKLGKGQSLSEFAAGLDGARGRWRWQNLDPSLALPLWQKAGVSAEKIHVVAVPAPSSGSGTLLDRFGEACGFDPAGLRTDMAVPNESLGAEAARWLEHVGPDLLKAVGDDPHWTTPYRWIRNLVAHEILVPAGGSPIRVDDALADQLRQRAEAMMSALDRAGYHFVGDPSDLLTTSVKPGSKMPAEVTPEEMLLPASQLAAALLRSLREETLRAEEAERRLAESPRFRRAKPGG